MRRQLVLDIGPTDQVSFDNFVAGENLEVINALHHLRAGEDIYIHGGPGTGKTHLLKSTVRSWRKKGSIAQYASCALPEWTSSTEDGATRALLCIDDADQVAGDPLGERTLLGVYELMRSPATTLVIAARTAPSALGIRTADLSSRLGSGLTYRILPLNDQDKRRALQLRATSRGFDLPEDVVEYVLRRYARDTKTLFALLDRIDVESLAAQRRVTLPFFQAIEREAV